MKFIEQIKKTPLLKRTVEEEYRLAKYENRQPCCVYCGKDLEIRQDLYDHIFWKWNEEKNAYTSKNENGDADDPYCIQCETKDKNFVDEELVNY